jgi:hypothetical protein
MLPFVFMILLGNDRVSSWVSQGCGRTGTEVVDVSDALRLGRVPSSRASRPSKTVRNRRLARCRRPRAVIAGHAMTAAICAGERPLPLRQQQHLAVALPEAAKRLVHQRLLPVRGGRLLRHGGPVHGQPLVQGGLATARAPLVGDHPPGRRVQPHSRGVPLGQLIQTTPGGQEHFSRRILRVACRPSPPAAVRDDVRAVRREQGVEALPCLGLAFPHVASSYRSVSENRGLYPSMSGTREIV